MVGRRINNQTNKLLVLLLLLLLVSLLFLLLFLLELIFLFLFLLFSLLQFYKKIVGKIDPNLPVIIFCDDTEPVEDCEQAVELLLLPLIRQPDACLPEVESPNQLLKLVKIDYNCTGYACFNLRSN